jgi:hypothetical protein
VLDQRVESVDTGRLRRVCPGPNPAKSRAHVCDDGAELVVVDKQVDAFAGDHVGELHAAEAGVEQDDTCAALAGGVDGFQEAPVIPGQDGHTGARTKAEPAPLVGQRISPAVQITETERSTLVDQRQPVVVAGSGDHRRRPQ